MKVGGIVVETLPYRTNLWQQHSTVTRANRTLPKKGHCRGLTTTYLGEEIDERDVREKKVDRNKAIRGREDGQKENNENVEKFFILL